MRSSRKTQMAILAIVSLLVFGGILMSAVTLPNVLINGTMADANQVMANFNALSSAFGELNTNYVPYWSEFDKKFINSGIYWNGTNVGIGTTSPVAKLHIDTGSAKGGVLIRNSNGDTWFNFDIDGKNYKGVQRFLQTQAAM